MEKQEPNIPSVLTFLRNNGKKIIEKERYNENLRGYSVENSQASRPIIPQFRGRRREAELGILFFHRSSSEVQVKQQSEWNASKKGIGLNSLSNPIVHHDCGLDNRNHDDHPGPSPQETCRIAPCKAWCHALRYISRDLKFYRIDPNLACCLALRVMCRTAKRQRKFGERGMKYPNRENCKVVGIQTERCKHFSKREHLSHPFIKKVVSNLKLKLTCYMMGDMDLEVYFHEFRMRKPKSRNLESISLTQIAKGIHPSIHLIKGIRAEVIQFTRKEKSVKQPQLLQRAP
ncbi:hypothetical protein RND71_009726 [Anisodus tanguticus]|uniref:Uncharacterized protein n=1 Tax=Anisodus tanguticus TaxID=243964 RepID=A0AAE1SK86_9SOLA|nr:hypothetical protein RND71_009726 [Anisodus tanguticus]